MEIPLTGLSTLTGLFVMSIAWLFVGSRIKHNPSEVPYQVILLRKYFLFMIFFFVFVSAPHIWLYTNPTQFPWAMAWGYVIGHIFLYVALTYIGRMLFSVVPSLADKEHWVKYAGTAINILITIITFATMITGTLPVYDYERHVTQVNASPAVGASIGIFAVLTLLPTAILFLIRAAKSHGGPRRRSLLLGAGFLVITVAGPLHDIAQNWQAFVIADILTILSVVLVGAGVVYRLDQSFTPEHPKPAPTI